jgi:hypothetical protein
MSGSFSFDLSSVLDGNLFLDEKLPLGDHPTHSSFHFFISQAVDEWI